MPIYEYRCKECGEVFERLIMEPEQERELVCPKCNSSDVQRVLSAFASSTGSSSSSIGSCSSTGRFT